MGGGQLGPCCEGPGGTQSAGQSVIVGSLVYLATPPGSSPCLAAAVIVWTLHQSAWLVWYSGVEAACWLLQIRLHLLGRALRSRDVMVGCLIRLVRSDKD